MSSKNKQVKGLLLKVDNVVICEVEEIQAEDGIRDRSPSRGLGDVYKRQVDSYSRLC